MKQSHLVPAVVAGLLLIAELIASEFALNFRQEAVIGGAVGAAAFVAIAVTLVVARQAEPIPVRLRRSVCDYRADRRAASANRGRTRHGSRPSMVDVDPLLDERLSLVRSDHEPAPLQ